jgi:site-specific DNA recombinase
MSQTTLNARVASAARDTRSKKRAVLYLRVSTPSQVHTDYNPEGISIPAQRDAGTRKAASLDADVVREFVEPGRTATSIEKRPVFQEMIAWVKAQKDIDYVIVYHFNRVFRNSVDAGITKRDLGKVGTRIVSTVLDMGEGPESAMVETIIHAVDQYQSQASGADIRYKMGQKVKNGGTVGQAALGYRNVREAKPEGGEIRTVAVDIERGPLIAQAFELFGTGQYNGKQVLDRITAAGLTTRGTRRTPPKPVSLSQLYVILSDRYYLGFVEYDGQEYPGRHQALVTSELFDRVQRVLALHGGGGTRARQHDHWLKGLIWCERCGKRLIVTPGRGNGGTYFYFVCRGRQARTCDQPYLKVQDVEKAVEQHYATVRLSDQFRANVRHQLDDTVLTELGSIDALKKRLTARLDELDAKEEHYLDLVGEPGWPKAKLQKKLASIAGQRAEIEGQLADTTSKLDMGRKFFLTALELLRDPQAFYRRGGAGVKHALTKVIFSKLCLDMRDIAVVSAHDLTDGLGDLIAAEERSWTFYRRTDTLSWDERGQDSNRPVLSDGPVLSNLTATDLLAWSVVDQGSSKAVLVELRGIEPLTFSMRTRRATNCATAPWSAAKA